MIEKTMYILSLWIWGASLSYAQPLSLDSCLEMAQRNYPLYKQYDLIEKSREYSISNAQKGYLPQVNIYGYSTYQSEVFSLALSTPGFNFSLPSLRKDQHRLYAELTQPITDLWTVHTQKNLAEVHAQIETQKLEVELYKLKDRIHQMFFGILLMDAQIEQIKLFKKDIQNGIDKVSIAFENGVAMKSNVDMLKVELLNAEQKLIALDASRKGFAEMLSLFIGKPISPTITLETPRYHPPTAPIIRRPELTLFDLQQQYVQLKRTLLISNILPKFSLFMQGGAGAPGLNIIKNDFATYYYGGIRLHWNLSSGYTYKKERTILQLNQNSLATQRDAFLFNTTLALKQENAEIEKMQRLIETDEAMIKMRTEIKNATSSQLANGTATSIDFLTQVNAEDQAKQNQILHRIQLLMAQYTYQTTQGN